jgi:xylulokinase
MYLMGIDVGSTSTKAVIYTFGGEIVSMGRRNTELHVQEDEHGERELLWKPGDLWNGVADAVQESLRAVDDPAKIKGLAVAGFGSDGVPIDDGGECLFPFISWHDTRTNEQLEIFKSLIDDWDVYQVTGIKPWFFLTILRTLWMKMHRPDVYERIYKWLVVTDYINYRLCGVCATDYSEASTTLVFDQRELAWVGKLFRLVDIDERLYPEPRSSGSYLGGVHAGAAERTGLREGTPVFLGGHDNMCSSFAAGGSAESSIVVVTGTFESVMISTKRPFITAEGMSNNLICEKGVVSDEYTLWGVQYAGGNLEWFKTQFLSGQEHDDIDRDRRLYALVDSLEHAEPGSHGLFMLPHILGSLSPVDDPKSRGLFLGISEKSTLQDFVQSIIEGINYQTRAVCTALSRIAGKPADKIINIGGAGYSRFWMQNRADILGTVVEVPDIREATSLGAALLAGVGAGIYESFAEATRTTKPGSEIIKPDMKKHATYSRYYEDIYSGIYPATNALSSTISDNFA